MILTGYIIVLPADLICVLNELATHIALTKQEQGCLFFEANQDTNNLHRFYFHEEFESRASLANHRARVDGSKWAAATINVERHFKVTDVQ